MMNFYPESALLASEDRRRRLLAEATQWRMLKARRADGAEPTRSAWFGLRRRLASLWYRVTPTPIKPTYSQEV